MNPDQLLARGSLLIAPVTVVVALGVGVMVGLGPGILVLAFGMLIGVVLLFWSSIGRLTGESPLTVGEALGLAAPSPDEERKRSILRALKDLEYERSVGKISEEDFAELSSRYRSEAKDLLKAMEAGEAPQHEQAEARLRERLTREGLSLDRPPPGAARPAAADTAAPGGADDGHPPTTRPSAKPSGATAARPVCPSCSTPNDTDASFCKRCGAPLGSPTEAP